MLIVLLLALIFLAILFPGFFRAMVALIFIVVVSAYIATQRHDEVALNNNQPTTTGAERVLPVSNSSPAPTVETTDQETAARERLSAAMTSHPGVSGIAQTEAESEKEKWSRWPASSAMCNEAIIKRYADSWNGMEPLYYIAKCSHSTVANLSAFAYAASQTGSSKEEGGRSIVEMAKMIALQPQEAERCLSSAGIKPFDDNGAWRDSEALLMDFLQNRDRMGLSCLSTVFPTKRG